MFLFHRHDEACPRFEARLEDYLEALETAPSARPDPELAAHLAACARCRGAFNLACGAGSLVRESAIAVPESLAADPFFASRVGALIREQIARPAEFLPLLESASLRLLAAALTLGIFLGALSASGVVRSSRPLVTRERQSDFRVVSPELIPARANADAVVYAVLTSERGR